MFDIGWSEVMVIGVVAVLVVGPKDLPKVIQWMQRTVRTLHQYKQEMVKLWGETFQEETTLSDLKDDLTTLHKEVKYVVDLEGNLQRIYDVSDLPQSLTKPTTTTSSQDTSSERSS